MQSSDNTKARSPLLARTIQGKSGFLSRFGMALMIGILSLLVILSLIVKYPGNVQIEAVFFTTKALKSDPKAGSDSCMKTAMLRIPSKEIIQVRLGYHVQVTLKKIAAGDSVVNGIISQVNKIDNEWNLYDVTVAWVKKPANDFICNRDSIPARITFVSANESFLYRIWAGVRKKKSY